MRRAGGAMLEVMVATAIFAMAALSVLATLDDGAARARRVNETLVACDLARSAMSRLEAGLAMPEAISGPVPRWRPEVDLTGFDDSPEEASGWELRVSTTPSAFAGLTEVSITAVRVDERGVSAERALYTLVQLVRLREVTEDIVGEEDEITERARRARPSSGPIGGTRR